MNETIRYLQRYRVIRTQRQRANQRTRERERERENEYAREREGKSASHDERQPRLGAFASRCGLGTKTRNADFTDPSFPQLAGNEVSCLVCFIARRGHSAGSSCLSFPSSFERRLKPKF